MRSNRSAWLSWIGSALLIGLFLLWYVGMHRDGLFNNFSSHREAIAEHEDAWKQAGLTRVLSREQLSALLAEYGDECITERPDWASVDLSEPLTDYVRADQRIACHFRTRANWPLHFPELYTWTLVLQPVSPDDLVLQEIRRCVNTV